MDALKNQEFGVKNKRAGIHWISPFCDEALAARGCTGRLNLLQSAEYALAMRSFKGQSARFGLISLDGQDVGFVQILEAGLFKNALHGVIVDRGPLWFEGYGGRDDFRTFAQTLRGEFPRRFGRRMRFIPEMPDDPQVRSDLEMAGYRRVSAPGYQTIWIDLTQDDSFLRAQLHRSWRWRLNKAERNNVRIEWDDAGVSFSWLMRTYVRDRQAKGYDGPSVELIMALAGVFIPVKGLLIGRALRNGKVLGAVMFLCHGHCATYQVGWNSPAGRDAGAHHILLWEGLKTLRNRGIKALDLGGVNDGSAHGVKAFKSGMGGELVTSAGLYH